METKSEAKELFLKYGGSFFQMDREGEFHHYKSFNISKEQEESWIKEYQHDQIMHIKTEDDGRKLWLSVDALVNSICNYPNDDIMSEMLQIVKNKLLNLDSFSKLLVSESILRLVDSDSGKTQASKFISCAKTMAVDALQAIINNPITASQEYLNSVINKDVLEHDSILLRAKKSLRKVGCQGDDVLKKIRGK